jgi:hypothetical protein
LSDVLDLEVASMACLLGKIAVEVSEALEFHRHELAAENDERVDVARCRLIVGGRR